jgi:hypothetical protein
MPTKRDVAQAADVPSGMVSPVTHTILPDTARLFTVDIARSTEQATFPRSDCSIGHTADHEGHVHSKEGLSRRIHPNPIAPELFVRELQCSRPKEDLRCPQSAIP